MAWSEAARAAAALARRRRGKAVVSVKRAVGYTISDVGAGRRLANTRHYSGETDSAMVQAEMRNPSFARVGRPRPGMVEVSHGVYQARGDYARTLKAARAQVRRTSLERGAKARNLHARVIAGRTVQASLKRRG